MKTKPFTRSCGCPFPVFDEKRRQQMHYRAMYEVALKVVPDKIKKLSSSAPRYDKRLK